MIFHTMREGQLTKISKCISSFGGKYNVVTSVGSSTGTNFKNQYRSDLFAAFVKAVSSNSLKVTNGS